MNNKQIHEKCICILDAIDKLQNRRMQHDLEKSKFSNTYVFLDVKQWHEKRLAITVAMIYRLKAYYLKTLNKLT